MDDHMLASDGLCHDVRKALHHAEERPHPMTAAALRPPALVARWCGGGNVDQARALRGPSQSMPTLRSRSRCHRRGPQIDERLAPRLALWGQPGTDLHGASGALIDSLPVPGCAHARMPRARLSQEEASRGSIASQKRELSGLPSHRTVPPQGQPGACFLPPGAPRAGRAFRGCPCDGPAGRGRSADKAAPEDEREDCRPAAAASAWSPTRPKKAHRAAPAQMALGQPAPRQRIATAGSWIGRIGPKTRHAVTARGVAWKVCRLVLA